VVDFVENSAPYCLIGTTKENSNQKNTTTKLNKPNKTNEQKFQ